MAVDYFLKIDGIKGESKDSKHAGEIELDSWSWGESQQGTFASGTGGGAGKVSMQDFHFTMKNNVASPQLFFSCASGKHIKEATLFARKAGEKPQEYLQIKLTDVLVSSYNTGGAGHPGELPVDSVSLNFAKIEFAYAPQGPDGQLQAATKAGWSLKENVKV